MGREKVTLHGAPETMLATLYGRALDSRAPCPVLGDEEAARAVARIDYDFRRTGITRINAAGIALRAKLLDDWTAEFLADHPTATVLHLACGLDTRPHRLAPPPTVRWVDVDYPEVVALRDRLLPRPPGDYRVIGASVTDGRWLGEVPADRPTVTVFEGLSMYLRKEDGKRLVQGVTGRFPSGQLLFDCFSGLGIRLQKLVTPVRRAGATLHWAVDDPDELEGWHEGLRCVDVLRSVDMPEVDKLPPAGKLGLWVMTRTPGWRNVARIVRYEFEN
ncbi:polyketide synthase [Streptomyces cinnamoneus]|uniref:Polyketide synthase n=1 Tax=Streptomyces cinnamoneus TaxID=53446 RepID=A0A2G1XHN9_STRCJ|nr:class I SAM-dependent methyltransferase [Streptomyces cinnamoneus]PHQ50758.1 polyketide synthase [Streptomyces cinnamoneus]PPT13984.1 class I SAM-dependent methyltransferase [Streptomyces cinnamoneus]